MEKTMRYMLLFAAGFLAIQGQALAETVQGQVTSVNPTDKTITIDRIKPEGGVEQNVKLSVPDEAQLQGINSLSEIQVGEQIQVEADGQFFGPMQVNTLTTLQAGGAGEAAQAGAGAEAQPAGGMESGAEEAGAFTDAGQESGAMSESAAPAGGLESQPEQGGLGAEAGGIGAGESAGAEGQQAGQEGTLY